MSPNTQTNFNSEGESFFATLLNPGSSLHPTFLILLDGAFVALLSIFVILLCLTRSLHIVVLMGIELALWASVKWYVRNKYITGWFLSAIRFVKELSAAQPNEQNQIDTKLQNESRSKEKIL